MNAQVVTIVSNIVFGISTLAIAVVAFFGLRTWRKELTGKAKFDVARNVILLALKMNAGFEAARNPLTFSGEHSGRSRQEDESSGLSQVLNEWYARGNRLGPLREDLVRIQEASWEAEILLGEDSSKEVSEGIAVYRRSYAELSSAIYSYFETSYDEVAKDFTFQDRDWLTSLRKIVYSVGVDDFSNGIDEATTKLKQALRTYVR